MVFSSHLFIFYFLPMVLLLYYLCPKKARHFLLTAMSYLFYGWANPLFVVLMFSSTVIDYICGLVVARQFGPAWKEPVTLLEKGGSRLRSQKVAMIISIVSNLTLLGFFKYFNFGIDSYNLAMQGLGMADSQFDIFYRITLPLGISFYTFQSMSYSIDVYRGDAKAIRNFTDFSCYVAMFPQLVAGPIIRFQEVANQLEERTHTMEKFARGVCFFCMGMAKKVMLANPCGKVADTCFDAAAVSMMDAWYGVFGYAFQIYFDFSAYSDMAIGLGLMMGFVFPKNFDSPYHSQSITELWQRWHISLSTWLRDYLYIPLGGNRKGEGRTYINLALVMLLGGLWHGSSWNFIIWGAIHGGMLALERLQGKDSFYRKLPKAAKILITFLITCLAWVFFRAADLPSALAYCQSMLGFSELNDGSLLIAGLIYKPYYVLSMLVAIVVVWWMPQTWDFTRKLNWPKLAAITTLFIISLIALTTQGFNPFIYFIF
ncbi:MAG: MBOAT family protein [Lentisphaeria bacterium]|nr:MBOAT family protein [Lentisphaeria bacterium]